MDLPKRIGRYDVIRLLGQGGMGRVLLAKDTVLGREVAIKIVRDDLGIPPEMKDALFQRMKQEARAAAAVSHPNFVTLHDMGEEPDVGLYLVFELVKGPTLRDRITQGPLELEEAYKIARDLGSALDRAHEAGVIHRDVKPENVLMSDTGVKLTDFGIARMPDSTLTRAGSVLGTAAYSAPEALALAEFSRFSDQFSLAATLYEAFGGARAFPGEDALSVASRIATEEPPLLKRGPDGEDLPRVHAVLARGMAKDPKKRFASATDLARALYNALDDGSLEPAPLSTRENSAPLSLREIAPLSTRDLGPASSTSMIPPPPAGLFRINNIIIAAALLLIGGLLLFGRHTPADSTADDNTPKPLPSTPISASTTDHAHPTPHRNDHRVRSATPASSSKNPSAPTDDSDQDQDEPQMPVQIPPPGAALADGGVTTTSGPVQSSASDASIHL
jgi:serine/threonine-protein kinase